MMMFRRQIWRSRRPAMVPAWKQPRPVFWREGRADRDVRREGGLRVREGKSLMQGFKLSSTVVGFGTG